MGCTRKHTNRHASDYPCTPRVQNAVYSHTQSMHIHVHTDYMPMNIHVLEGEGKSYVSWDYVPGRYQETLASGFHIAILSFIKIFFVISFSVGFLILWVKDIRTCTCPPLLLRLEFSWDGLVRFLELSLLTGF